MKNSIKARITLVFTVIVSMVIMLFTPIGALHSYAAEAVSFTLPLSYKTNANKKASANIKMTYSTENIAKGTVITLSGLPGNCKISNGGNELVAIIEVNANGDDLAMGTFSDYTNGTMTYTVKNSPAGIHLMFGPSLTSSGKMTYEGYYCLDASGAVMNGATNKIVTGTKAATANTSALANASVNTAEFNAQVYYDNNPDLQTAIGADAQKLYDHWVTYGKAEGRKAK